MANDDETVPDFKPDVPESTALVKTAEETKALALKMAGEELPNQCRFHCITCGWNETLEFEDGEIQALDGDITSYGGPCPPDRGGCGSMTLTPHIGLFGPEMRTIYERAKKNRLEEAEENAEVLVSRIKKEVVSVMSGSTLDSTPEEQHDPANVHDPRPPGQRDDLPDADSVSDGDLSPREE